MSYREQAVALPGTVLWCRDAVPAPATLPILPDGCIDLIWDGSVLFVAGPDSRARWYTSEAGAAFAALRFSRGAGPAVLGVRADELRDRTVGLDELWPAVEARRLSEQVAVDAAPALSRWATAQEARVALDPFGPRMHEMVSAGLAISTIAGQLGYSSRQLHRRCLAVFGYGPRRLGRILRLGRALDEARQGSSGAAVAACCGYADQAHLVREVRDLVGTTPSSLMSELRAS